MIFLVKKQAKNIVQTRLATFHFQDACHHQMADAIKRSNHGHLTVDKHTASGVPIGNNSSESHLVTKEALQLTLNFQSIFLDTSHSTTPGYLSYMHYSSIKHETKTCASQLESHIFKLPQQNTFQKIIIFLSSECVR